MFKHFILLFAVLATLASCNSNKFKVEGTVEGATDTTQMVLEMSSNGYSLPVDRHDRGCGQS